MESVNYIQGETIDGCYTTRHILHQKYRTEKTCVAAIDGVFMAIPSRLFRDGSLSWDENNYSGYHFYDMDMCMQINRLGLDIVIEWNVVLEHFSCGDFNKSFIMARQIWYNKWKDYLPVVRGIYMTDEDEDICRTIVDITDRSYQYLMIKESLAYRLGKTILHLSKENIKRLFKL